MPLSHQQPATCLLLSAQGAFTEGCAKISFSNLHSTAGNFLHSGGDSVNIITAPCGNLAVPVLAKSAAVQGAPSAPSSV